MVLSSFYGNAQNKAIDFQFQTDTVSVKKGVSFINFLVLKNTSNHEIHVKDVGPDKNYPGLLLSTKPEYTLAAGEKKRLPIKFIANMEFMTMSSREISYKLSYTLNQQEESVKASFFAQRNEEGRISLNTLSHETYINPEAGESTFSLFVENHGFTQRSIKLTLQSNPDGLNIHPKQVELSLDAQEKKRVEFRVNMRHKNNFSPDYTIQVKATDLRNNENIGNTYLRMIVLSNNKQILRGAGPESGKNFVEMAYINQSNSFNYLQLRSNTEFYAGKDVQARFNTVGDFYLQDGRYNFYDTWLELEKKGSKIRLGNLYGKDYGYNVSGRGGKISTEIGTNKRIEVLALENNYYLLGNYFSGQESSKIAGAKYEFGEMNSLNGKVSYVFDHNPRLNTDTQVASSETSFSLDSIHNFRAQAGLSHEKGLITKDENFGVSTGLDYEVNLDRWSIRSMNSWSSENYAGLNRGAYSFNQYVNYRFSNKQSSVFARYQNSQVRPEYLKLQSNDDIGNQNYYQYYYYKNQIVQTGVKFATSQWRFLLSPKFEKQNNSNSSIQNVLTAYRFQAKAGRSFGNHSIDLSAQYSYSKSNENWFNSLETMISYRYNSFSLNGTVEMNPHDVIDLNHFNLEGENYINYNIHSAYNFQFFNNSFSGSISAGVNYSELYNNLNQNINSNFEFKISDHWAATGYFNYSEYESIGDYGFKGNNYQFRIGVKKYFTNTTASGNYKVNLQLFHDENLNGVFDNNETAMANEMVYLDDFVAITDKKGKLSFQNVPQGSYKLKVNDTEGLRLMRDPMIVVDSRKNIEIGLIKNNKVTGKLIEIKQKYDALGSNVRGVIVYAEDSKGNTYNTLVNNDNEFEFFLKNGTYKIYIKNNKYEYLKPVKEVTLNNADYSESLIFKYKKKNVEIKIKKF